MVVEYFYSTLKVAMMKVMILADNNETVSIGRFGRQWIVRSK